MPPKLRKVSGEEAIRALERLGLERVRQRGSHVIMKKDTPPGKISCSVPLHRELKIGTLLWRVC
jgi:predicted RNA binding protein YcfA (HicA-like mRNA interferase family)